MQEWIQTQRLLEKQLVEFLNGKLPFLGGDKWWDTHVFLLLTPPQQRAVGELQSPSLGMLDFAALLRVCVQNWYELTNRYRTLRRTTRSLIVGLIDFRNLVSHQAVDAPPIDVEEYVSAIETALKLFVALGATDAKIDLIKTLLRRARDLADEPPDDRGEKRVPPDPPRTVGGRETASPVAPKNWLLNASEASADVRAFFAKKTYIGIDFGTSTTVVSSLSVGADGRLASMGIPIDQPGEFGEVITHHLVNTVLARIESRTLFGNDAYRLRQRKYEGIDVFSSFKMRLGANIGPCYPESQLNGENGCQKVTSAQEATGVFFTLLMSGVRDALRRENLPQDIAVAVTVPASFEANQRRDLLGAMSAAGITVEDSCLIDEPNAAFLSYLLSCVRGDGDSNLLSRLRSASLNILVYDFGAGTCDVSILEVCIKDAAVVSRNRAISRFTALGGDDIDREIARHILLPQLLRSAPNYDPTERDREERLVPWLVPTAERLKICAVERAEIEGIATVEQLRESAIRLQEKPIAEFSIRGQPLKLDDPSLSLSEFAGCMSAFIGRYDSDSPGMHVFAPAADAMAKAGLPFEDLNAVLFIGGSAANSFVQSAVMAQFPSSVAKIVPGDLRSHVSQGAAIHSFGHHAMHHELIRPITSEPIFVVTRGGGLDVVVPAGAEVPSANVHVTELFIDRPGQQVLELPICVSNEAKLLGIVRLDAPHSAGFSRGTAISLSTKITAEKILEISATAGAATIEAQLLNPLSNTELTPQQATMLEARQAFNQALLDSRGNPPVDIVIGYARASGAAGFHETAADMLVQAERLNSLEDFSTSICFHYSRAGKSALSTLWAEKAVQRDRNPVNVYNLSCKKTGAEREGLLEEAIKGSNPPVKALLALGKLKQSLGQQGATSLLERAVSRLEQKLDQFSITSDECDVLIEAAEALKKETAVERARDRRDQLSGARAAYNAENLAASVNSVLEGVG